MAIKKNSYRIEWQIETISKNAILKGDKSIGFDLDGIHFEHWDFNLNDAWVGNRWIATSNIEEQNFKKAVNVFYHKLGGIIPIISFVSQCYVDFVNQPYLVIKKEADLAYFRNTNERRDSGLMFCEKELKALELLFAKKSVPEEFFLYWNDAVNTIGYSAKLLIMFSALEALVKHKMGTSWSQSNLRNDYREKIIGKKLLEIFYAPGHPNDGLRNRLNHGEYLSGKDIDKNYVHLMHKKILRYFNNKVIKKNLITVDIKNPQRHILPRKRSESKGLIKCKLGPDCITLKELLASIDQKNNLLDQKKYEYVSSSFLKGY